MTTDNNLHENSGSISRLSVPQDSSLSVMMHTGRAREMQNTRGLWTVSKHMPLGLSGIERADQHGHNSAMAFTSLSDLKYRETSTQPLSSPHVVFLPQSQAKRGRRGGEEEGNPKEGNPKEEDVKGEGPGKARKGGGIDTPPAVHITVSPPVPFPLLPSHVFS
eukprot:3408431-Rhodomonas_salina.1